MAGKRANPPDAPRGETANHDWQEFCARLGQPENPGGETAGEIAARLGRDVGWVRRQLRAGLERGLIRCERAHRAAIDGRQANVGVYQFTAEGRKLLGGKR